MNGNIEILAPAGGEEQLLAAVRCGADAVYLGMKSFSARSGAENFDGEALSKAVAFCHGRGVSVHVAVNTVAMDGELSDLERTADLVVASGADAVILQDLAAVKIFREKYPTIKRHMSTQAAVHNLEGAKAAIDLGFDRVVLARELTLEEIRTVVSSGIECEVFVHGALCMCVSGTCYLSSALGGRSGNRGRCAQPCRLNFTNGEREYALSLKDMSHIKYISDLKAAGVASLKIEGRLKRPEYVAAAVTACRRAEAGLPWDEETLRAVFSRAGFTDGYITGKRDVSMFGRRDESAAKETNAVLGSLRELYRRELSSVPVDMKLFARMGENVRLTACCEGETVTAEGDMPLAAENRPTDRESVLRTLGKTGGTPFVLRDLETEIGDNLVVPSSVLNGMKRECLEKLLSLRERVLPHKACDFAIEDKLAYRAGEPGLWLRFGDFDQLCCEDEAEKIILPAAGILAHPEAVSALGDKLIAELPYLAFPDNENRVEKNAEKLLELGVGSVWAENIYGVHLGKRMGFRVFGGFGLNITNTTALKEYGNLGLESAVISIELPAREISSLGDGIPRGVTVYGHLPLMRFRACPAKKAKGCRGCDGKPAVTDRYGAEFPLVCEEKRFVSMLNPIPLDVGDRRISGVDFRLAYFTVETREKCRETVVRLISGEKTGENHTTGMYYSKLL
ncbi:MAG: U32 family peptidase [Clostridia bacterium]|nr:U32 family peptidase [Clostridia bacterium]